MKYKLYIVYKILISRLFGYLKPFEKEAAAYKEHIKKPTWGAMQKYNIAYQREKYDFQNSADQTIEKKAGDCEDIHRVFQVGYHLKGYKAYLVSMWGIDIFNKRFGHAFCVCSDGNGQYTLIDYNDISITNSLRAAVEIVRHKYKVNTVKAVVIQDIAWKIVKEI